MLKAGLEGVNYFVGSQVNGDVTQDKGEDKGGGPFRAGPE